MQMISAHGGGHVVGGAWKSSFEDRKPMLVVLLLVGES